MLVVASNARAFEQNIFIWNKLNTIERGIGNYLKF